MNMLIKSLFLSLVLLTPFASAKAISLEEAKEKGKVGEERNGYLGIIQSNDPEVSGLVSQVNKKRKEKYEEIAKSSGTTVSTVEQLAAKKALEATKNGNFVKSQTGEWKRK